MNPDHEQPAKGSGKRISEPTRLVLKYALVAGLWIVVSDVVLSAIKHIDNGESGWNIAKGLLFVAVTGGILYALARRMQTRIRRMEEERQTALREANARLQRAKGLYAVLTRANQAALTAADEKELYNEIGAALVSLAGLRFVWFSRVNEDTGRIEPVAWTGDAPGYLDAFKSSIDPAGALGQGLTARAIRGGQIIVCNDMLADPLLLPWHSLMEKHGFQSSACVPIGMVGRRAAISAYAGQKDFFDEELGELMEQLAKDIKHGIEIITTRNERARLNERLHLMQTAIEAAPSGIVIADVLGRIEWVNPAFTRMTGYTLETVSERTPSILKSGRQGPAFYETLWNTISHGNIWSGDLQNQRRDGSIYWEHMVIAPVLLPSGAIEHYVAIKQDISSEKEMEQQVARTQRLESIGLLAGGIAHDLNNVLAPILMAMDLFKLRYTAPADQERLEMVRKSAERGAGIVRQVLTFARGVDGERMNLRPEHLIKEVRQLLQETLPRKIEIPLELDGELPFVTGDPTQLHQVLLNLGVNARDAMQRNGGVLTFGACRVALGEPRITLSGLTVPAGEYVVLSVKDTGSGITPEVMEHMFEPFYTTKPRGEGTGLGLSTVLGIVRGHGGGLDVTSRLGEGTEFRVLLPVAPTESTPRESLKNHEHIEGGGRVILVVDDEEPVRAVIGMALEASGFVHVDACDGQAAVDLFGREPGRFAAVILDRVMPKLGGDEVASCIKALRPELPIILTSGLLSEAKSGPDATEAYRRYGDLVLRKPFSQSDLFAALTKAFALKRPV
ncbi:MAG: GAF domain-containing protein [Opitutaceae bacterium]|nr:GAF domain-containing protein [Opitutaceae bacterium]